MKIHNPIKYLPILFLSLFFLPFVRSNAIAENLNELFQTVAFLNGKKTIYKKINKNEPKPYEKISFGTGFFVRKDSLIYLVTAEHLTKDLEYDVKVTIHGPNDKPLTYDIVELSGRENKQPWIYHGEADVAILPLKPVKKIQTAIIVIEHNLLLIDDNGFFRKFRDRLLTVIGFPLALGLKGKFSPIFKSSKLASGLLRLPRGDNKIEATFFILDDPSTAGFSGAPVYAQSQIRTGMMGYSAGPFACVGLVHGTLKDNTGGKFAAIVPSYFITQTIEQYEKK